MQDSKGVHLGETAALLVPDAPNVDRGGPGMTWVRVGPWVVNTAMVSAVYYDGSRAEIFVGGEISRAFRGGFTAQGEEARRLWELFCGLSSDIEETELHRRVKR